MLCHPVSSPPVEARAYVGTVERCLKNKIAFDVIDAQVAIAAEQRDARFQLKSGGAEDLAGEIRVDAKPANVKLGVKKNAR